jgi:hypothetical protein
VLKIDPNADPGEQRVLLVLDHVAKLPPPQTPPELTGWLDVRSVKDPQTPCPALAERGPAEIWTEEADGSWKSEVGVVDRADAAEVLHAYGEWSRAWESWAAKERHSRPRRALYDALAKVAKQLSQQDDVLEAVLAVGLYSHKPQRGNTVQRHLVTRRLTFSIDPRANARLTVSIDVNAMLRLEDRDFLEENDGFVEERVAPLHEQLSAGPQHPLSPSVSEVLTSWRELAIEHPVRYAEQWTQPSPDDTAKLSPSPAIILRVRDSNALVSFYERILMELNSADATVPLGLAQLVAPITAEQERNWLADTDGRPLALGADPLFPLPTNPAQTDVLRKLQTDTGVVVQGPPGTGKTHTIANLISALLAQGKRVLVTSQKDQALRVLRRQLPEPIRDLCVLVGDQRGGSSDLERSVSGLSDRVSSTRPERLDEEIGELEGQRVELRRQRSRLIEQIRTLREAETVELAAVAPGYAGKPAAIVELVQERRPRYSWFPPLPAQAPDGPPLTGIEAAELLNLLRSLPPEQVRRGESWCPDPVELPTPERFGQLIEAADRARAAAESGEGGAVGESLGRLDPTALTGLETLLDQAAAALHQLGVPESAASWPAADWRTVALGDQLSRLRAVVWAHVARTGPLVQEVQAALRDLGFAQIDVPPLDPAEFANCVQSLTWLRDHLAAGRKLRGRFAPEPQRRAQQAVDQCRIDGVVPQTAEEIGKVLVFLDATAKIDRLARTWRDVGVMDPGGSLLTRIDHHARLAAALPPLGRFGEIRDEIDALLVRSGVRTPISTPSRVGRTRGRGTQREAAYRRGRGRARPRRTGRRRPLECASARVARSRRSSRCAARPGCRPVRADL